MTTPSSARSLISLAGVRKAFGNGVVALDDLNLDVQEGEFVSLLGPSGCGKSTVLRLIAGLMPADSGQLQVAAATGPSAEAWHHDVAYVFQEPTLMPWATAFDNVWLPLRLAGLSRAAARQQVCGALAGVGLDGFETAYPRQLSGGMKMRVSIARALVTHPRLLLMDEPFAALDEITRFKLNDDLLRLQQEHGWTVVFVTHSVFESVYLASRIAVMTPRPGRVAEEISVDVPYPRTEAFRTDPRYAAACQATSAILHRAMGAPA
ncbi:ABC transporter ATP-binding protein [Thalassobaculum sp.]|uniref:ABC transporter ATP-binding protein n=1 Tax=Thalassobaculum sp. TaxID=2022740 RepID=UPI0032EC3F02